MSAVVTLLMIGLLAQAGEERGEYRITLGGRDAGVERYRIETFPEGELGLFSKTRLSTEVGQRTIEIANDTSLTLDRDGRVSLYAGIAGTQGIEQETRLEARQGEGHIRIKAAGQENRLKVKLSPDAFLLDNNSFVQIAYIARRYDVKKGGAQPIRVFLVAGLRETEGVVEDRGPVELRAGEKSLTARHRVITLMRLGFNVYLLEDGRAVLIDNPMQGARAVLSTHADFVVRRAAIERPSGVEETEASFRSGTLGLEGSFTRPKGAGRWPAVVLLSGSGPQDRDSNAVPSKAAGTAAEKMTWTGLEWNLFRSIAYSLSSSGVAALRFDDRGVGRSGGDFATAKVSDFVADARAAVAYLRARPDVDPARIGLVGHSEGAIVAILAAQQDEKIRAIFLMACPAKPLDSVILQQVEMGLRESKYTDAEIRLHVDQQRQQLEAIRQAESDYLDIDGRRMFVGWLREHLRLDPSAEIGKVRCGVVVFQGRKDRQVVPEHAERLGAAMKAAGRADAEVRFFDELDHLFMKSRSGIADYADPTRHVDAEFLKALCERAGRHLNEGQ